MFALGRLVSVLLATKFSPAFMLLCNIVRTIVHYSAIGHITQIKTVKVACK